MSVFPAFGKVSFASQIPVCLKIFIDPFAKKATRAVVHWNTVLEKRLKTFDLVLCKLRLCRFSHLSPGDDFEYRHRVRKMRANTTTIYGCAGVDRYPLSARSLLLKEDFSAKVSSMPAIVSRHGETDKMIPYFQVSEC